MTWSQKNIICYPSDSNTKQHSTCTLAATDTTSKQGLLPMHRVNWPCKPSSEVDEVHWLQWLYLQQCILKLWFWWQVIHIKGQNYYFVKREICSKLAGIITVYILAYVLPALHLFLGIFGVLIYMSVCMVAMWMYKVLQLNCSVFAVSQRGKTSGCILGYSTIESFTLSLLPGNTRNVIHLHVCLLCKSRSTHA